MSIEITDEQRALGLPCPFCGAAPSVAMRTGSLECEDCDIALHPKRWNRRVALSPAPQALAEGAEREACTEQPPASLDDGQAGWYRVPLDQPSGAPADSHLDVRSMLSAAEARGFARGIEAAASRYRECEWEDHSWDYFGGAETAIRALSPAQTQEDGDG